MRKNTKPIWTFMFLIVLCIISTTAVLADLLTETSQIERELIPLFPTAESQTSPSTMQQPDDENLIIEYSEIKTPVTLNNNSKTNTGDKTNTNDVDKPATTNLVVVSDEDQVWGTQTDIEIFKISYVNGNKEISVLSSDDDPVIAPGTENEYTFQIKNNWVIPVQYGMTCEVYVEPLGLYFPVEMSLKNHEGNYLIGDEENLVNVADVAALEDSGKLAPNNYVSYTLNWRWPFEWGNDEYDTYLGDRAVDEDLKVSIIIKTIAWSETANSPDAWLQNPDGDKDPDKDGNPDEWLNNPDGSPQTGDTTNVLLFIVIAFVSFAAVIVVFFLLIKKKKTEEKLDGEDKDPK